MPVPAAMITMTAHTTARAADVNTNFTVLRDVLVNYAALTDVARTFTAIQTFSAVPVFSAGITVVGNSTITGTLGGVTTLTCTTVTATNLGGTLTTASQPNITTLAGLTAITVTTATIGTTTGKIIGGSTSLSWRNNADSADIIKYTEGTTTLALAAGTITLQAGGAGNVVVASNALATTATTGFICVPGCGGVPTGAAPQGALVWDTSANKLYLRNASTWTILN